MSSHHFKLRYVFIPIITVLVLFLVFAFIFLPPRNLLAMIMGTMKITPPEFLRNYIQKGRRDYSSLPDLMTFNDGSPVESKEDFILRQKEMLKLFEDNVYGRIPRSGFNTDYKILEEGKAFGGKATRRQIEVTVSNEKASASFMMLMYEPVEGKNIPAIVSLNSMGNHSVDKDPEILSSLYVNKTDEELNEERGARDYRWNIENLIDHGYAFLTVMSEDLAPDDKNHYKERVGSLLDEDTSAISLWAFGLMREVDYLYTLPEIDTTRIASIGHSRLGKANLWAGANDDRISMVIANGSGASGASLSRNARGESYRSINLLFPHWFIEPYRDHLFNIDKLPVDQHMLISLVAPRKVYVANAYGDLWADPDGSWISMTYALPGYEIMGCEVFDDLSVPGENEHRWTDSMGYHNRPGFHDLNEDDWNNYLGYMDKYWN